LKRFEIGIKSVFDLIFYEDFMLETRLITEKQHKALSMFKNYIPFFREGNDLDEATKAAYAQVAEIFLGGKGFSGRDVGIRSFKGSARRTKKTLSKIS